MFGGRKQHRHVHLTFLSMFAAAAAATAVVVAAAASLHFSSSQGSEFAASLEEAWPNTDLEIAFEPTSRSGLFGLCSTDSAEWFAELLV